VLRKYDLNSVENGTRIPKLATYKKSIGIEAT
jgi:hypothetical protein